LLLVFALVAAGACGDAGTTTSTTAAPTSTTVAPSPLAATPAEAVERWLLAVDTGSAAATRSLIDDTQLALILAMDNPITIAQLADLVRNGIPTDLRSAYWSAFGASFSDFAGADTGRLQVKQTQEFAVGRRAFAAVEIGFVDRIGSTTVVTAAVGEGWIVDLMATLGPTLVRPLRDLLAALGPDDDGNAVRSAMAESVPSLRAALERPGVLDLPVEYVLETESLVEVLSPPID
jgi:hypothetical protein